MATFQSDFKTIGSSLLLASRKKSNEPYIQQSRDGCMVCLGGYTDTPYNEKQIFEITAYKVILSNHTLKTIDSGYRRCVGVKIRWQFLGETASSPIIKVVGNVITINEKYVYKLPNKSSVHNFVFERDIRFDVFAIYETKEKHVGFCDLQIHDCVANVDVDMVTCLDLVNIYRTKLCKKFRKVTDIGNLVIKYKLHPALPKKKMEVKELFKRNYTVSQKSINLSNLINSSSSIDKYLKLAERESQSSICSFLQKSADLMPDKGCQCDEGISEPITITIKTLSFNENCIKFNEPKYFSIKYNFLTHQNIQTPTMLLVNNGKTYYDYTTVLKVHASNNMLECRMLSKMIKEKENIWMTIIECIHCDDKVAPVYHDVGFAELDLSSLIEMEINDIVMECNIFNIRDGNEKIGMMEVGCTGIQAMKRIVSDVLKSSEHDL